MLRALFLLALLFASPCEAQTLLQSGSVKKGAAETYVGPGDVVASAKAWWGSRAYNNTNAAAHANIGIAQTVVGAITCTMKANVEGELDIATHYCASNTLSLSSFCLPTGCSVGTLYDQSGGTNCGGSACDLSQATAADQPLLLFNCANGHPCLSFTNVNAAQVLSRASSPTQAQPFTYSHVSLYFNQSVVGPCGLNVSSYTCAVLISDSAGNYVGDYFVNSTGGGGGQFYIEANSSSGVAATTAAPDIWYSQQAIFNGSSSSVYQNGSSTGVATPGASAMANSLMLGNDTFSNSFIGYIGEAGAWAGAFSGGNQSAMYANQKAFWGTP